MTEARRAVARQPVRLVFKTEHPEFLVSSRWRPLKEIFKIRFGRGEKLAGLAAPLELQPAGVQGVVRQDEPGALLLGKPVLDQRQIQIRITAVNLVAQDGMAEMRQVKAKLMFAAGERTQAEEGKS